MFLLYILTKSYLRTMNFENSFLVILIGSIPNLTAAIGISLALFLDFYKVKTIEEIKKTNQSINFYMLILLLILISEEFFPFFSASKICDKWDIIFTLIGISFSFFYKHKLIQTIKKC